MTAEPATSKDGLGESKTFIPGKEPLGYHPKPGGYPDLDNHLFVVYEMIAFEVIVNGKKVCTAGIKKLGNLCAHVDWCQPTAKEEATAVRGTPNQWVQATLDYAFCGFLSQ